MIAEKKQNTEIAEKETEHSEKNFMSLQDDDVKNLCDNFFSTQKPLFSLSPKIWNPPTDVYETKEHIIIKMEIAGVNKSDIEISLEDNLLKVGGFRHDRSKVGKENFHIMEIHYGNFERVFRLPKNLGVEQIEAIYQDGFLKISIPKVTLKQQEIEIKIKE